MEKEVILVHQLTGVRMHMDISAVYDILGMPIYKKYHEYQSKEELCNYFKTRDYLMKYETTLPTLSMDKDVAMPVIADKATTNRALIKIWFDWEKETLEMYRKLREAEPTVRLWKYLYYDVKKEISLIHRGSI